MRDYCAMEYCMSNVILIDVHTLQHSEVLFLRPCPWS